MNRFANPQCLQRNLSVRNLPHSMPDLWALGFLNLNYSCAELSACALQTFTGQHRNKEWEVTREKPKYRKSKMYNQKQWCRTQLKSTSCCCVRMASLQYSPGTIKQVLPLRRKEIFCPHNWYARAPFQIQLNSLPMFYIHRLHHVSVELLAQDTLE